MRTACAPKFPQQSRTDTSPACQSQQQRLQSGVATRAPETLLIIVTCIDNKPPCVHARIGHAFENKATHVIACIDIGT